MADSKISALPSAATPLAGTEVLPIVQGGATVKVPNNDLRPKQIQSNATSGVMQITGPAAGQTRVMTTPDANFTAARTDAAQSFAGNQTLSTGNLVIGTAGKGIDFSADSHAAGMTSELLDDYEEGTWTPTQGTMTVVGTFSSQGHYTKVGRQVFISGYVRGSTSISGSVANYFSGVPFLPWGYGLGALTNNAANINVVVKAYSDGNVYMCAAIAPTQTIYFSVSYFV